MRRFAAVIAAAGVLALTVVPASSAVAVQTGSAFVSEVPDIENVGGLSLRQKMLTVLGSLLSSDSGTGTSRAHFYSAFNTGFSEQKLRRMMEHTTLNPGGPVPQRAQDYVLQAHEFETPIQTDTKTGKRQFRLSPSPRAPFTKVVNGSLSALAAGTFVPVIGGFGSDVVGGWMGYSDLSSEWCTAVSNQSATGETVGQVFFSTLSLLSGRDCSMFDFPADYVVNGDTGVTVVGTAAGYSYLGTAFYPNPDYSRHCYSGSSNISSGQVIQRFSYSSGLWSNVASPLPNNGNYGLNLCKSVWPESTGFIEGEYTPGSPYSPALRVVIVDTGEVSQLMQTIQGDPERYQECVITLNDGSTLVSVGETYRESSGQFMPAVCDSVPEDMYATNISVNEKQAGSTDVTNLYDQPTTDAYQDWATTYPECADGACLLDLRQKSGSVVGLSCFDVSDQCVDWFSDPNKQDNFQCTYGAHDVSIDECAVYSGIFKPGRVAVGAPYSDPMTGDWDGTASAPRLDGQAMAQTVQNPSQTRACNGLNITGFDPVGFVLRPIQCALEWAFVPRPLVVEAELAGGEASWEGKPPAVIAAAVGDFALTPAVSGCSKSVTIFSGVFEQQITPIDVCPGSMARPFADASRVVTAAVMVVLVIIVLRRQIAGMVGYGQGQ